MVITSFCSLRNGTPRLSDRGQTIYNFTAKGPRPFIIDGGQGVCQATAQTLNGRSAAPEIDEYHNADGNEVADRVNPVQVMVDPLRPLILPL